MNTKSVIGLLVGLVLIGGLFAWRGLEEVFGLLAEAGPAMLWMCVFAPVEQYFGSEAWRVLFPPGRRPGFWRTHLASWKGIAVNTLLPVATIGGEMAKARVLSLWGAPGVDTASTVVVDKTAQALGIVVWGAIGVAVMSLVVDDMRAVWGAAGGLALLGVGIGGFIYVQLKGGFAFAAKAGSKVRKAEDGWRGIIDGAEGLDDAVRAIYRRPGAVVASTLLRVVQYGWLSGEVLLAAYLMGHDVTLVQAVMLRAMVQAIRGVSFAIPAGIGVQEGGFVAIGALVGLPADLMIAVSLASRVREVLPTIPFFFLWQHTEGKALLERRKAAGE